MCKDLITCVADDVHGFVVDFAVMPSAVVRDITVGICVCCFG